MGWFFGSNAAISTQKKNKIDVTVPGDDWTYVDSWTVAIPNTVYWCLSIVCAQNDYMHQGGFLVMGVTTRAGSEHKLVANGVNPAAWATLNTTRTSKHMDVDLRVTHDGLELWVRNATGTSHWVGELNALIA